MQGNSQLEFFAAFPYYSSPCMKSGLFNSVFMTLWIAGLSVASGTATATSETATPSSIVMKSPALFVVNEREVESSDLIRALKKQKIPTDAPLIVEVPPNTPMNVIKDLTQQLATAGYKPVWKGPRQANASVQRKPAPVIPAKKQKRQ